MNDEELLFKQVQITTAASPGTTVWVYRCVSPVTVSVGEARGME
jgi:hypothetical protein